jgi:hypothetical protein
MLRMAPSWAMRSNFICHTAAKWRWWETEALPLFWCMLTFPYPCGPSLTSTAAPEPSASWAPSRHLSPCRNRPLSSTRHRPVWVRLALSNSSNNSRFIKASGQQLTWCSRLFRRAFCLPARPRLTWRLWRRVSIAKRPAEVPAASAPSATSAASTASSTRAVTCAYATIALWRSTTAEGQPVAKDCVPSAGHLFATSFEPTDPSSLIIRPMRISSFFCPPQKSTKWNGVFLSPSQTRCPSRLTPKSHRHSKPFNSFHPFLLSSIFSFFQLITTHSEFQIIWIKQWSACTKSFESKTRVVGIMNSEPANKHTHKIILKKNKENKISFFFRLTCYCNLVFEPKKKIAPFL